VTRQRLAEEQGLPAPGRYREDSTGDVTGLVLLLRGRGGTLVVLACAAALAGLLLWLFL
jgi:hypothetical protein